MKIVRHPYQASIAPQAKAGALWHFVVRVDGCTEVVAQSEASSKEDACCAAMLELARLQRKTGSAASPAKELRRA